MDEPFNGIDLAGTIVLRHWLKEMKASGKCVILSSHIVSAISDICDEIIYIHKGKVVADFSGMSAESIEHCILEKYIKPCFMTLPANQTIYPYIYAIHHTN